MGRNKGTGEKNIQSGAQESSHAGESQRSRCVLGRRALGRGRSSLLRGLASNSGQFLPCRPEALVLFWKPMENLFGF